MKMSLFRSSLLAAAGLAVGVLAAAPTPGLADYRAAEAALRANDIAGAIPLLEEEAQHGNPVAAYNLGKIYEAGSGGIAKDYAKAATWYRQAAEIGSTPTQFDGTQLGPQAADLMFAAQLYSQYGLARLYEAGRGVPQDSNEAVRWYRRAADQDLDLAQLQLVRIYRRGSGAIAPDLAESTKWLERVAQGGNVSAMTDLGTAYLQGIGVEKNAKTAHDWYERAAALGNGDALYNLGLLYQSGYSGQPDPIRAADYYNRAANQKNGRAMLALGDLYAGGQGVPHNQIQALVWYELAADNGIAEAIAKRDALTRELSEADVDQANAMAASWQPQGDRLSLPSNALPAMPAAPAAAPEVTAPEAPAATPPAPEPTQPAEPAAEAAPAQDALPPAAPPPEAFKPGAADAAGANNGTQLIGTPPPGAKPFNDGTAPAPAPTPAPTPASNPAPAQPATAPQPAAGQ